MNWHNRDFPRAFVVAVKRSAVHVIGVGGSMLFALLVGLPVEYDLVPDVKAVRGILSVVYAIALVVTCTWGLVLVGSVSGHFYSALDELRDSRAE